MSVKTTGPAKWVLQLLRFICPGHLYEGILGDLLEQYEINKERSGKFRAHWLFVYSASDFIRFEMLRRKRQHTKPNTTAMLLNYLLIAFRNLRKQKHYHLLNFTGLTLGLSCCALVLLYADHELSYDDFHQDPENTFRITGEINYGTWFPSVMNEYAEQIMAGAIPEIDRVAKFRRTPAQFATYEAERFATKTIVTNPGSDFFNVFDFQAVEGSTEHMLQAPNSVVLTKSTAERMFGAPPYTEKLIAWDTLQLRVSGVIEDLPSNTHLNFNMLVAADVQLFGVFTYVTLSKDADIEAVAEKIKSLNSGNENYFLKNVVLQPLESIHLAEPLTFELKPPGNIEYLYLFSTIALLVLVISCTNYMNLSAAIYTGRMKEMGIRKVMGSSRKGLALQFLTESTLLVLLTLPLVLLIVELALPAFSQLVNVQLSNTYLHSLTHVLLLHAVAGGTGIIAGLYPVLTMTQHSAIRLFKGRAFVSVGGLKTRKTLLTLQFTILLFLGTGAYLVNKQLSFIQNKDLGIDNQAIIKISNGYGLRGNEKYEALKNRTLASPHIEGFTVGAPPGTELFGLPYTAEGHEERRDALSFTTDADFFDVMGVEGLYGEFFDRENTELPALSMLVNEAFVRSMGWDNPIGKKVTFNRGGTSRERTVAGVFKDYHNLSLHHKIAPQFIFVRKQIQGISHNIMAKVNTQNMPEAIQAIEDAWYSIMPDSPIVTEFLDDDIQAAYQQEQTTGKLSLILSALAITLAVVGLIGLGAYMAELRIKEVGIRKVLGASMGQILLLLNKEYLSLILIATIIASSLSYYVASSWLETFAFRTSVQAFIYPIAGLAIGLITFLTISIQSGRAARRNPVEALKHE